jgi:trans-2,3-dihydro-3-hydroxyanthranilate isomerase
MPDRFYRFAHVDVFTTTPFEGNPLAVFPDAEGLDDATMQRIARELNLSETAFVFAPRGPHAVAALRIFTPAFEVPFAGHPTLGTAFVLWKSGMISREHLSFTFEEGVGPVAVRIEPGDEFMAWLTTPRVSFGERFADGAAVAAALGLAPQDLLDGVPVQVVTAGTPFVYVALRDRAAVDGASLDARAIRSVCGDHAASGIYVFALHGQGVHSRMFAPEFGIIEDPATGGATGPLAAFTFEHGLIVPRDGLRFVCEQGTAMGRRSILQVLVSGRGPDWKIEVGGSAVGVIDATLQA